MTAFILRRLAQLPLILLAIYTITFLLVWVARAIRWTTPKVASRPRKCARPC